MFDESICIFPQTLGQMKMLKSVWKTIPKMCEVGVSWSGLVCDTPEMQIKCINNNLCMFDKNICIFLQTLADFLKGVWKQSLNMVGESVMVWAFLRYTWNVINITFIYFFHIMTDTQSSWHLNPWEL